VPWLVQAPAAFFGSVLWKYRETNKERQKITKAFGLYIPDSVVDNVVKDLTTHRTPGQMVFGAVMFSGGERLTSLSESTLPLELSRFMNSYYETMFNLVRRHGGTVSDVMGDSMLALWAMVDPDPGLRLSSCRAALEIIAEMGEFKCESAPYGLKTRIGLHYGPLLIGTIGGRDHYEYRPVGEVVNTAARIESLNKRLGTRVLVSGDVLSGDSGFFLVRKLGDFVLAGKSKVIEIYELMARKEAATNRQLRLAKLFVEGLSAFREQRLDEAVRAFDACLETGEDGPANYYIDLCRNAVQRPSGAIWDGAIRLEEK
jgi:adenylate cyclase